MKSRTGVLALVILGGLGCHKPEEAFIGSWKPAPAAAGTPAHDARISDSTLDVGQDQSVKWTMAFGGRSVPMEGKWSVSQEKLLVKFDRLAGQSLEELLPKIPDDNQRANFRDIMAGLILTKGPDGTIQLTRRGDPTSLTFRRASP